jgi:putative endonuclease
VVRTANRTVGDDAEKLAFQYLKQHGLTLVQRNFSCRLGELDLIMRDRSCLIIVEVRFRGHRSFVTAELTVDHRKQTKIIRTAAMFLAWNERFASMPLRFDVVAIDADAHGETTIKWIRDAFRPADNRL